MEIIIRIIITGLLIVGVVALGYLFCVGICWLLIWAYNIISPNDIDPNIWAVGLIVFIVMFLLRSIFSPK